MRGKRHLYRGKSMTLDELAETAGITRAALCARLYRGRMTLEEAMTHRSGDRRQWGRAAGKYEFMGEKKTAVEISEITCRSLCWVYDHLVDGRFTETNMRGKR